VPQLEVWVDGVLIARLDIGHPDLRYAVEYDGVEWHSSPEQQRRDRARRRAVRRQDFTVDVFERTNVFGQRRDVDIRLMAAAMQANRTGRVYL
jgi:very-short-patch-repair endonuclease